MRPQKLLAILLLFTIVYVNDSIAQTTIYDIQYVDPASNSDVSPYVNQIVTVNGVVTASRESGNLGTFFMQQPDITAWAGIQLDYAIPLSATEMGDIIEVTGKVIEEDGVTKITSITKVAIRGKGNIIPVSFDPDAFTNASLSKTEQYEGMLISLNNSSQPIFVVNSNPNAPNNNGEWRVGSSMSNVNSGCRILSGVQTNSISSSLNVSYMNHIQWATNSGIINVAPIIVNNGNEFYDITGIMTYNEGNIVLLPRNNDDFAKSIVGVFDHSVEFQSLNIYPNPIIDHATLAFEINQTESVIVNLYDLEGKLIQHLDDWIKLPKGEHKKTLSFNSDIVSGNYLLKIESDTNIRSLMVRIN